jgi:hypothetical protein
MTIPCTVEASPDRCAATGGVGLASFAAFRGAAPQGVARVGRNTDCYGAKRSSARAGCHVGFGFGGCSRMAWNSFT